MRGFSLPSSHSGKVAIITGSSRGIGKAIALKLAEEGADVAVCARSEQSTAKLPGSIGETSARIRTLGRRALAIRMDVTSDQDVQTMVDKVMNAFGRIDILVNNAALSGLAGPGKPFLESDSRLLDRFFCTNVRGPFVISSLVGAEMARAGGGVIVNISSRMGRLPTPGTAGRQRLASEVNMGYAITKAALDRFSAAIAAELLRQNIAVITVYPGLTAIERLVARTEIDLSGAESPQITANAVSFLCKDPMTYTGQFLVASEVVLRHQL